MSGPRPDLLGRAADALGGYLMGDVTVREALDKICAAALDAVADATMAGISMTVDARVGTYVHTHPVVETIDQAQFDAGDGPCVDAFRTGVAVIVDATIDPGPYPKFRTVAADHGMLSTMSVPMRADSVVVGAINLYAPIAGAFDQSTVDAFDDFATHAAFVLLNHQAVWYARSMSENLQVAMRSRAEIEQAKGVIMATRGCSADEAFDQLRRQSQHENVKVREIAAELVRRAHRAR